jgi:hypothetical protein
MCKVIYMHLTEEESGMLMPFSANKCSHVWMGGGKMGCLGSGNGLKNGAVDHEHGSGMDRSLHSRTKGHHSK